MKYYTVHFVFDNTTVVSCIESHSTDRDTIILQAVNTIWWNIGLSDEVLMTANGIDIEEG